MKLLYTILFCCLGFVLQAQPILMLKSEVELRYGVKINSDKKYILVTPFVLSFLLQGKLPVTDTIVVPPVDPPDPETPLDTSYQSLSILSSSDTTLTVWADTLRYSVAGATIVANTVTQSQANTFIQQAALEGKVALFDIAPTDSIYLTEPIYFLSNNRVVGRRTKIYTSCTNGNGTFNLNTTGQHLFKSLEIRGGPGTLIFQAGTSNPSYLNIFEECNIHDCFGAYRSAATGTWNSGTNTVTAWAGFILRNSFWSAKYVTASIYGQAGPSNFVFIRNSKIYNDSSHCLYLHPNVSYDFRGVYFYVDSLNKDNCTTCGTENSPQNLGMHYYTGGGVPADGVDGRTRLPGMFNNLIRVRTHAGVAEAGIEMSEDRRPIRIANCDTILLHGSYALNGLATNTHFLGGIGSGVFKKCTGNFTPVNGFVSDSSNWFTMETNYSGSFQFKASSVDYFYSSVSTQKIYLDRVSDIGFVFLAGALPIKVYHYLSEWSFPYTPTYVVPSDRFEAYTP